MWMIAPLSIGAAVTAALMLWNPFYWGLYLSMRPGEPEQQARLAAVEPLTLPSRAIAKNEPPEMRLAA